MTELTRITAQRTPQSTKNKKENKREKSTGENNDIQEEHSGRKEERTRLEVKKERSSDHTKECIQNGQTLDAGCYFGNRQFWGRAIVAWS